VDVVNVMRELWRRRGLVLVVVIVAAIGAAASQYNLPSGESKTLEYASAQSQMLVDIPHSPVADVGKEFEPLVDRAAVYAKLMTSASVMDVIGKQAGVPGGSIIATAPLEANQPKANKEPGAEQRGVQLLGEEVPKRLFFAAEPGQPIITISSQAPTARGAIDLANAAVTGFRNYITDIQESQDVKPRRRVRVEQLGPATGGVVNEGASKAAMVMIFIALFIGGCILILFLSHVRRGWRDDADEADGAAQAAAPLGPTPIAPSMDLIVPRQWNVVEERGPAGEDDEAPPRHHRSTGNGASRQKRSQAGSRRTS
jgi:hypothetical protein